MYREVVGLGVEDSHYDIHKDSETPGPILSSAGDRDDNNAVDIDDVEGGERDYGAVGCNDLPVQSVDREQRELLAEPLGPHVRHSWHPGTFPWGAECASNAGLPWAAAVLRTGAVNEHSTK
jgi:hypothetical protein